MNGLLSLLQKNAKAIGSFLGMLVAQALPAFPTPEGEWWVLLILPSVSAAVAWLSPKNAN